MKRISVHALQKYVRAILVSRTAQFALVAIGTAFVTTLVLYLTPLHYLNMVEPPMRDGDPAALYQKMQASPQDYLFVDVRPTAAYVKEHAVGSISIPLPQLYDARYQLPKHDKTIVLICGDAKAAGVAFGYLGHYGFLNTVRIAWGLNAWKAEQLPTEKS